MTISLSDGDARDDGMPAQDGGTGAHGRAAALFKALADPHRLTIVQHLLLGEHRVADLVSHLGLAQSTVSAHVGWLRDAGLLASHSHGRATYYTLAHPHATRALLAAAEHVLACTGEPADLCFSRTPLHGARDE